MVNRSSYWSLIGSVALLASVIGGCEAIFQFDEKKLDSTSTAGNGGTTTSSTTQGGGGTTMSIGGGGSSGSTTGGGGSTGGTAGSTGGTGGSTGGTGGAGGCTIAADCPGSGSECVAATCDNGVCGTMNVAANTPAATQTVGDCKSAVCDGNGAITTINDDADTFDDMKDCTIDACNMGLPESAAAPAGMACNDNGGKVCDGAGTCVECNLDADCMAAAPKCAMNVCVPASCNDGVKNGNETDVDCGGGCGSTCNTGDVCAVAADCLNGVCTGMTCAAASCNDGVKNANETDKDCGGGTCVTCGPSKGCNVNADCAGNQCSGAGGTCVPNCSDGVKNNAEVGVDCGGGTCAGCSAGGPCGQDNDCASGNYCDVNQTCALKKTPGVACVSNNQCASGSCVDGVCCNSACAGTCQACNLPGLLGTCSPIAAGQDPIDECAGAAAVCDGAGACKKANGQTCAAANECAVGQCVDGYCCNSACAGTCIACNVAGSLGTCTNVPNGQDPANECAGAINCNGNGGCGALLGNGNPCSVGTECQSNNCIDGYCCGTVCSGTCQACNIAGSLGTCTNIPNTMDPANECANGACNGAGLCKLDNGQTCAAGSACLSTSCVDGYCCNAACSGTCQACNVAGSLGTCSSIANGQDPANECVGAVSCNGAGACGFFAIGAACSIGAECVSGNCVDGVCCNTACAGTCAACNLAGSVGTCSNIANGSDPASECVGATACNGAGACALFAVGAACTQAAECTSTFCVDGVCCANACSGTCQACSAAKTGGSNGTCGNVTTGSDPDNECAGTQVCSAGACKKANGDTCAVATDCVSANCVDGYCCNTACGTTCQACNVTGSLGTCTNVPANTDPANECAGSTNCNGAGACGLIVSGPCMLNAECQSGFCVDGNCCNSACSGLCQACNNAGSVGTCSNITSGSDPANECIGAQTCNGAGACAPIVIGGACTQNAECGSGFCVDGFCCNSACSTTCQACSAAKTGGSNGTCAAITSGTDPDSECAGSQVCSASTCKKVNGDVCATATECLSANCIDGYCCNTTCGGSCQACNVSGSLGSCTNVPSGTDPASECAGATNCNGAGSCALFSNGTACSIAGECSSTQCVDGVCCNAACSGICQACSNAGSVGTCSNIAANSDPANECIGATTCSGAGSCALFANGTACSIAGECSSGNCVDGVCCNTACGGTCTACNLAGSVGTCTNIPNGQDPANECSGAQTCNGTGACVKLPQGSACTVSTDCVTGFCADGFCCDSACTGLCKSCDGTWNSSGDGFCSNIDCADPQNECAGSSLCQVNGTCGNICL